MPQEITDAMRAAIKKYSQSDKGKFSEAKRKVKFYIKRMIELEASAGKNATDETIKVLPQKVVNKIRRAQ